MSAAEKELAETWKVTAEKHLADSYRYQALLYHAWDCLRSQQKGLNRQARRIKKLRARLAVLEAAGKEQIPSGWNNLQSEIVHSGPADTPSGIPKHMVLEETCGKIVDPVFRGSGGLVISAGNHSGPSFVVSNAPIARRVVCAAIRYGGCEGVTFLGPRHFDSTMIAMIEKWPHPLPAPKEQGFIDQFGAFMSREAALKVATEAGQIIRRCGGDDTRLFSENLY